MPTATKKAAPRKKAAPKNPAAGVSPDAPATHALAAVEPAPTAARAAHVPHIGALVGFRYMDPTLGAGGAERTRYGMVVEIAHEHPDGTERRDVDNNPDPGARIVFLGEPSDPVSLHELEQL